MTRPEHAYTEEELEIIRTKYPLLGIRILPLLSRHTLKSICEKARRMGIKSGVWAENISNSKYKGNSARAGRKRAQKLYPAPKGFDHHHIDGNPLNNASENILITTRKHHMEVDGRLTDNPKKRWNKK